MVRAEDIGHKAREKGSEKVSEREEENGGAASLFTQEYNVLKSMLV